MKQNVLMKHGSTLAIIASGASCLLSLILSGDNTIGLKYLKIQSIFFCIPMILMFCNVKRLAKRENRTNAIVVCSIIGQLLLTFVSVFITISSIDTLNYKTNVFGITFILNILALSILVNVLLILGLIFNKRKESN